MENTNFGDYEKEVREIRRYYDEPVVEFRMRVLTIVAHMRTRYEIRIEFRPHVATIEHLRRQTDRNDIPVPSWAKRSKYGKGTPKVVKA